jgi:ABC-type multidrug transport system ATPase subunit
LIDEPELHLHPKAQESLAKLLLEESKDKQIIISTHSPYLFKSLLNKSGIITLKRNDQNKVILTKEDAKANLLFPWSPSWGEINFNAYDMPTIDFHNELYGYLQEREKKYRTSDVDTFLVTKGITKEKEWIKLKNGKTGNTEHVTLQTYIRNSIHHPENTLNNPYTDSELKQSIEEILRILKPT